MELALALAATAVLVLMLYLIARKPRDPRLRALATLVASWAVSLPVGLAAQRGIPGAGGEPMVLRLIQHALLLVGAYGLICFVLFSAFDSHRARTHARWYLLPLGTSLVVLTVATAVMPADLRSVAAQLPALPAHASGVATHSASVGLFYSTANSCMAAAYLAALVLILRHARSAEPRLRRGLLLASAGLAGAVMANSSFAAANITRWAGGVMPRPVLSIAVLVLLAGSLLFLIGISYPTAVMRLATLRIWWRHRQMYRQLGPLWTALHAAFPEDALTRIPTSRWRDAVSVGGVHRRYYRRVIECRDGLVRISPYIAHLRQHGHQDDSLADLLKRALQAHAASQPVTSHAMRVAIPTAVGLDADADELTELSRAL